MNKENLTPRQLKATAETNARYAGKKFNMLTFVEHAYKWAGPKPGKNPLAVWRCDCGNKKEIRIADVREGRTTCCGCATNRDGGMRFLGQKWNKLQLIELVDKGISGVNYGNFLCDCGNKIEAKLTTVRNNYKKSCGCDMSEILRASRGFTLNETVFETITDNSAYWLGFLLADGNVSKNTVAINLKTSDTKHLEKFRDFVGGNQAISVAKDPRVSRYAFGSKKITADLADWWIVPAKSYTAKPHPELLMNRHFWRGLVDGDGSVRLKNRSVMLCGTEDVCKGFLEFAKTIIQTEAKVAKVKENLWVIRITCGRPDSVKLIESLYLGADTYLDRKYEDAVKIIGIVERGRGVNVEHAGKVYRTKYEVASKLGVGIYKLTKFLSGESPSLDNQPYKAVTVDGVTYQTKTEAMKKLGIGYTKLENVINGAPIENQLCVPVTINGVNYQSKSEACSKLGVHFAAINRYLKTGSLHSEKFLRVCIGGVEYPSINVAARSTGIATKTIRRNLNVGTNYFKSVSYNGEEFKSVTKLAEHLGIDRHDVKEKLGDMLTFNYIEIRYV